MNKLNKKVIGAAVTILFIAMSAGKTQAAQPSTEQVVSQFVVAQGKQLMSTVSEQVATSISSSIETFSVDAMTTSAPSTPAFCRTFASVGLPNTSATSSVSLSASRAAWLLSTTVTFAPSSARTPAACEPIFPAPQTIIFMVITYLSTIKSGGNDTLLQV